MYNLANKNAELMRRGAGAVKLAALEKLASNKTRGFEAHPLRHNDHYAKRKKISKIIET